MEAWPSSSETTFTLTPSLNSSVAHVCRGFFGAHSVSSGLVGELAAAESKAQASSLYLLLYYAGSSVVGTTGELLWKPYGWSGVVISLMTLLLLALAATAVLPALPKEPPPRKDPT